MSTLEPNRYIWGSHGANFIGRYWFIADILVSVYMSSDIRRYETFILQNIMQKKCVRINIKNIGRYIDITTFYSLKSVLPTAPQIQCWSGYN